MRVMSRAARKGVQTIEMLYGQLQRGEMADWIWTKEHPGCEIVLRVLPMDVSVWQVQSSESVDGKAFPLAWH